MLSSVIDGAIGTNLNYRNQALAAVLNQQGHSAKAEQLQREALDLQRRTLGSTHPDTIETLSDLATTLAYEGRLELHSSNGKNNPFIASLMSGFSQVAIGMESYCKQAFIR